MANEKRLDLIDRGATLEELCRYCIVGIDGNCPEGGCAEFRHISQLPTVDAVEVVHGHWCLADDGDGDVCSVCGTDFCNIIYETGNWNYCPNCGAKMDGDGNERD